MFRFGHPEYLYLLVIIPVLAFLQLIFQHQRKKKLKRFGNLELISHLMPDISYVRPVVKFYLLLLALAGLIITLASPQFGTKLETVKRKGIELIIALDVSNSMNATDVQPSRLARAKLAIERLADKMVNDRIGLIVFAGEAYVQLPITSDYASAKLFLSGISTDMVPTQGTAIGAAIRLATKSFSQQEGINRAIVIITDGENHEDDAIVAAKEAIEKGIKVYTVGMGSPEGAPIPVSPNKLNTFMKDNEGNVVITKMNPALLREIAEAADGKYIPANNLRAGINDLIDELGGLKKSEIESKVYTDYDDKFQYPAALVILILLIELIILERKNKLLKNIDLFTVEERGQKEEI
ncbi:VWA domain-containing protein [Thermophagus xiamenensis]|uniref:Ca-activated chloride channel family protein n=1 Tax=Thermophagus xiamenensis TaxID=385682 RepID=A0A1I2AYK9_9BACT|nr:VWA domain-containing protein [Thermophagus xiamenensis]SFE48738.1 Ca-activated chloride channel family protein [Thermophagus xiamenensis]